MSIPERAFGFAAGLLVLAAAAGCPGAADTEPWERESPVQALPAAPLGTEADLQALKISVTPEKVRLGRWLFFDKRLSADGTIACATCHRPENAFSEPTAHSTGIRGQEGGRKAPSFVNGAWPVAPFYFWDGRAASLEEQAKGPMTNPIEMGMKDHDGVVGVVRKIAGYKKAFKQIYGDEAVDIGRIANAISAYEATRMSGNSAWDRAKKGEAGALSEKAKRGEALFFEKGQCAQCHLGWNFTDSGFHNLGIGWDGAKMADPGRAKVSGKEADTGAFKTPTLRDVSKHAPYMHDGSLRTLRDVVEHYNKGGTPNPHLSPKVKKLDLTPDEVDAIVAFMEALDGTGYQDTAPKSFPQ